MIIFIGCLLFTILSHELGHMLTALYFKVGVKAFAIGFGKPTWHKVYKGIDFRICPFPFGGYCDIKGMDSKKEKDDFLAQPYRIKFAILTAGVFINIFCAILAYVINYGSISYGIYVDWLVFKAMLIKNTVLASQILVGANGHQIWLIQFTLMSFFCGITNLFPIPALDGGHCWIILMEKIWKENFIELYSKINQVSFFLLIWLQVLILVLFWS